MELTNKQKREIVRKDYNAIGDKFVKVYNSIDYCKKYIDDFVKALDGKNVLDVGCGAGIFSNYLSKLGVKPKGVDFSSTLINIAKQNYPNIEFVCSDICNYHPDETFDGIFVKDMLFHLSDEDILKTLSSFKKLLKPNGKICIIMDIPNEDGEHLVAEELDENYIVYYNGLTPLKLKALLEQSRIAVDELEVETDISVVSSFARGIVVVQATNRNVG